LFSEQKRPVPPSGASPEEIDKLQLPTDEQWSVIELTRTNRMSILTGGPGVGKSFAQTWLMDMAEEEGLKVHLCAPTGKAARRMQELTGHEAKTIHRLLEFNFFENGFQKNESDPLEGDLLIVDETSMLQLDLADSLFKAVPDNMHILLVGDPDQLPPVGAGKVFDDLIKSELVPRIQLNKIFRQAAKSMIIQNSRKINAGQFPYLKKEQAEEKLGIKMLNDFFWIARPDAETTLEMVIDTTVNRLPRAFGFDPREDIMVLAPMKKGKVGLDVLNQRLELALNPGQKAIIPKRGIAVGSRIVQTKNMYMRPEDGEIDKSVMNGEVGVVKDYNKNDEEALISFDKGEREFWLPIADMDSFFLAWALTIHRSQGSSWPCVVTPVSYAYYKMLSRSLEYVAVTRAEKMCVMIGEKRALSTAIKNVDMKKRNSSLIQRIRKADLSGELF
jgi:exodeoxyribonuclease V alpha subunit